jgi:hypothetical protein
VAQLPLQDIAKRIKSLATLTPVTIEAANEAARTIKAGDSCVGHTDTPESNMLHI